MCFAPQRRAFFQHLNLQKWTEPLVFLTFWLGNMLRATTACTFSTSGPPKVVRTPGVFSVLTSNCASRRRALFRHLNCQKWSEPGVLCTFGLGHVLRATTVCTLSTSQLPKVVREWCVLNILTWTCASRQNGMHFFDIWTSKSGPRMVCFVHFDFEMCFAPQRRALFPHLNLQKRSEPLVFLTFDFELCFAPACTFSTSQLPKVVRTWCALYIWTWKCASRHNGVHFVDISTPKVVRR